MKIGVAFSGSGPGALCADVLAEKLNEFALPVAMVSATSAAAAPLLLWHRGLTGEEIRKSTGGVFTEDLPALATAAADGGRPPLTVNAVDTQTGITVLYSDNLNSDAWNLRVLPLSGREREALRAAASPWADILPEPVEEMLLCDFAVRYGCPYFPLKMAGMERLLSVNFSGGHHPAQIAADSLSELTGRYSRLHYTLHLDEDGDYDEQIRKFMEKHRDEILDKLLF